MTRCRLHWYVTLLVYFAASAAIGVCFHLKMLKNPSIVRSDDEIRSDLDPVREAVNRPILEQTVTNSDLPGRPSPNSFSCAEQPQRCGFVFVHLCLNASKCSLQGGFGSESSVRVEEALVGTRLSASRLRSLIHPASPVVLITNYDPEALIAFERELKREIRSGELASVASGESDPLRSSASSTGAPSRVAKEQQLAILTGGGEERDTNYEAATSPAIRLDDERRPLGVGVLRQLMVADYDGLGAGSSWGPFSHVLSLSGQGDGHAQHPHRANTIVLPMLASPLSGTTPDVFLKPDVLRLLLPHAASTETSEENSTVLSQLQQDVSRWMYLDGDTLVQPTTISDWKFKDSHPSVLSNRSIVRLHGGTRCHLDASFLNNAEWREGCADPSARTRSSGDALQQHQHVLYDAMDLLQWDDMVMVPELNSQRDVGPHLYNALLQDIKYPDVHEPVFSFAEGYRYAMLFERQFNTGLAGFRSTRMMHRFMERWSRIHRDVERCRYDRVAWDQCSLPRALREQHLDDSQQPSGAHRRRHLRVASLWEPFNARDALGRGCSTVLYANTIKDFRMNREHAVVLHRHGAKRFMKALLARILSRPFSQQYTTPW